MKEWGIYIALVFVVAVVVRTVYEVGRIVRDTVFAGSLR